MVPEVRIGQEVGVPTGDWLLSVVVILRSTFGMCFPAKLCMFSVKKSATLLDGCEAYLLTIPRGGL